MDGQKTNAADGGEKVPSGRGKLRIKRSYLIAILLAIGATVWVASGMFGEEPAVDTTTARPHAAAKLVEVRVTDAVAEDRPRTITVFGKTDAIEDAEIKAETAGRVVARPALKGTTVKKGTVLLELAMNDRQAKLRDAEAKVGSARISYTASKNLSQKQFESQTKLAEATATLAAAEAALDAIKLDIARTKITAPIDGYVEELLPSPGDYIAVGDRVATVLDLDPIRVVAQVSERDVADIALDDIATVMFPNGAKFDGRVKYVSRLATTATRTYRIDIWIDNPEQKIPAGQTTHVTLATGHHKAHRLRKSALTLDDRGSLGVKTVDAEGTVGFQAVKIIDDTPDGVWVEGLPDRARVITLGQEFVTVGQKVKPVPEAAGTSKS